MGEEIIDDIKDLSDSESDPEMKVSPPQNAPSMALARWLLIFLMFMQAVYQTLYLQLSYVSSVSWPFLVVSVLSVLRLHKSSTLYKARKYLSIDNLNF